MYRALLSVLDAVYCTDFENLAKDTTCFDSFVYSLDCLLLNRFTVLFLYTLWLLVTYFFSGYVNVTIDTPRWLSSGAYCIACERIIQEEPQWNFPLGLLTLLCTLLCPLYHKSERNTPQAPFGVPFSSNPPIFSSSVCITWIEKRLLLLGKEGGGGHGLEHGVFSASCPTRHTEWHARKAARFKSAD